MCQGECRWSDFCSFQREPFLLYLSDSFSMEMFDVKQFWALKWEKIIANIRHDYELLYASIHRETIAYYEKKTKEVQVEFEQVKVEQTKYYREVEIKKLEIIQQTFQLEHKEMQQIYAYEKENLIKLEATYCKWNLISRL
jgi:hypothetical protein